MAVDPVIPQEPEQQNSRPENPRSGEYLLIIEHEQSLIYLRIQSRRRALSIAGYEVRSNDLSFELNFYPYRAALLRMDDAGHERMPHTGEAALTHIPAFEISSGFLDLDEEE